MAWLQWAVLAAVAAAATTILAKVGIAGVPATTATAIRTGVVLIAAWALVFTLGEQKLLSQISRRSLVFLVLSGVATGVSWLAYFRALQLAPASLVLATACVESPNPVSYLNGSSFTTWHVPQAAV